MEQGLILLISWAHLFLKKVLKIIFFLANVFFNILSFKDLRQYWNINPFNKYLPSQYLQLCPFSAFWVFPLEYPVISSNSAWTRTDTCNWTPFWLSCLCQWGYNSQSHQLVNPLNLLNSFLTLDTPVPINKFFFSKPLSCHFLSIPIPISL